MRSTQAWRLPIAARLAALTLAVCAVSSRPARATAATAQNVVLFVATDGNDQWSGTLAEPSAAKTDGPFATLERARDEMRRIKARGGLPAGGARVG
jgi:hypothetical protein